MIVEQQAIQANWKPTTRYGITTGGLELVFESPVWSGLLTLRDLDRNRNWSIKVLEPQKTGPDHL